MSGRALLVVAVVLTAGAARATPVARQPIRVELDGGASGGGQAKARGDGSGKIQLEGDRDRDGADDHDGAFARLHAGLGVGWIRGTLEPVPGFRGIPDLSHAAPALGVSFLGGWGFDDFALPVELRWEMLLTNTGEEAPASFQTFSLGVAPTYYFDNDVYITAALRYAGLILTRDSVPCFWDRLGSAAGPGVGLTLGKEWFNDRMTRGLGLALQANYTRYLGDRNLELISGLVLVSFTGWGDDDRDDD